MSTFLAKVLHCCGGTDPHQYAVAQEAISFCDEWLRKESRALLMNKGARTFGQTHFAFGLTCLGIERHGLPRAGWAERTFEDWLAWPVLTEEYRDFPKGALVKRMGGKQITTTELLALVDDIDPLPESRQTDFLMDIEGHGLLRQLETGKWQVTLPFFVKAF